MAGKTHSMPQSNDYKPGTWKGLKTGAERSASFTCPLCRQTGVLTNHTISAEGVVTPSLVCPTSGCTFHEFIELEGWEDVSERQN
jgi:hypothetical protein